MKSHVNQLLAFILISIALASCSVTNNLYLHNANPYEVGEGKAYVAMSSGLQAKIDSVDYDDKIHYSERFNSNLNLNFGADYGIAKNLSIRGAIHLPYIIGGFGLRGGLQYSFLPTDSYFNIALGADAGFVVSRDSVKIFGDSKVGVSPNTSGALNADVFIPVTFNITDDLSINLAARYSFNTFRIRYNTVSKKSYGYNPEAMIFGFGLRYKAFYFEANTIHLEDDRIIPTLGIGAVFKM
jgi:hypothetical protein